MTPAQRAATPAADARQRIDGTGKVPEMIARRILRDVVARRLVAGDKLAPEAVMLEQFGVGRASLREALRILEIHGLIRIKPGPNGGPLITENSSADYAKTTTLFLHRTGGTFRELLEARRVMEPVMARLAAERLRPEHAERIRAVTTLGWDNIDTDDARWADVTEQFHAVVAGATGNRVLDLYSSALVDIHRQRIAGEFPRSARHETLRTHDRIADAILSRDAAHAEELTRRHIEELVTLVDRDFPDQLEEVIEWW